MSDSADVFSQLTERVCGKVYPIYIKILENQLTSDEAKILVGIADKKNQAELAESLNMDQQTLAAAIDDLKTRRYVVDRKGVINIPRSPHFFPRGPYDRKTRELWTEFFRSGGFQKIRAEEFKVSLQVSGAPPYKVIPAHLALLASPNIAPGQVLWYENMAGIFKRTKSRFQNGSNPDGTLATRDEGGCLCKIWWTDSCDHPGGCTGWEWETGTWGTDTPPPRWPARRSQLPGLERREITIEEALAACHKMEDAGQIHINPNSAQSPGTCNCCPCCCLYIQPMKNYGDIYKLLSPSRYLAVIDEKKCQEGCRICADRCYFDAIEFRKSGDSKVKAFIIDEHCLGCGLCIFKCPTQAMRFELVRPPAHIPTFPLAASM